MILTNQPKGTRGGGFRFVDLTPGEPFDAILINADHHARLGTAVVAACAVRDWAIGRCFVVEGEDSKATHEMWASLDAALDALDGFPPANEKAAGIVDPIKRRG